MYDCEQANISCGCSYRDVELTPSRIVGGEEALPYSWSMIVSIQYRSINMHFCGGSILDESHILTAAHCVDSVTPDELRIVAGVHNLTEIFPTTSGVDAIYVHPNWSAFSSERRNDIAILRLSEPFNFFVDPFVRRTCVPHVQWPSSIVEYPANRTRLAVIGWGTTRSGDSSSAPDLLQQAEVFLIHHTDPRCNESLYDIEKQFCAGLDQGGKGECLTTVEDSPPFLEMDWPSDLYNCTIHRMRSPCHCVIFFRKYLGTEFPIPVTLISSLTKSSQKHSCLTSVSFLRVRVEVQTRDPPQAMSLSVWILSVFESRSETNLPEEVIDLSF